MTIIDDARQTLGQYNALRPGYEAVQDQLQVRNTASQIVADRGHTTAARQIAHPNTPDAHGAQIYQAEFDLKRAELEDLVNDDVKFGEIIDGTSQEKLQRSLMTYDPLEKVNGSDNYYYEGHHASRLVHLFDNRSRLNQQTVDAVVDEMSNGVKKFYAETYKVKADDSDSVKRAKQGMLFNLSNLYYDINGDILSDGLISQTFQELKADKINEFRGDVATKDELAEYIYSTIPDNVDQKIAFLNTIL